MCGIVGIIGRQDDASLTQMNAQQRHRGPDDAGEYRDRDAGVALAMTRLSIVDLTHGHQPMTSRSGRSVIVFNGEIFNAPDLRRELEAEGAVFQTANSDTEVVLELWERRGEKCLDALNGMFAFAIHDRAKGVVFGARDPLGIKPLYYAETGGAVALASELKALLVVPGIERELDRESLFHYLTLRFVPGARSIFRGISRLLPGHSFTIDLASRTIATRQYWAMAFAPDDAVPERDWPERIRAELRAAVGRWALSDVPIACSLSGGLDSSVLVGLLNEAGSAPIRTYSLGFAEAAEADLNELPLARQVAERFGTDHHEVILGADRLLDDLLKMVWSLDEPYGGGLPSWYVFEFMSRDVKVGLTGSGADELFGDYGRYREYERDGRAVPLAERVAHRLARHTPALAAAAAAVAPRADAAGWSTSRFERDYVDRYYYCGDQRKQQEILAGDVSLRSTAHELAAAVVIRPDAPVRDSLAEISISTQLPDEFLAMTDRFSMAHSLEARVPYLDREFVALMARVPARIRTQSHDLKYLLKKSTRDLLPADVLSGRKRGFVLPTAMWLRGRLRPLVERLLGRERLTRQGVFRPDIVDRIVKPHLDGTADHQALVWSLLMFQLWHILFIEQPSAQAPTARWSDLG